MLWLFGRVLTSARASVKKVSYNFPSHDGLHLQINHNMISFNLRTFSLINVLDNLLLNLIFNPGYIHLSILWHFSSIQFNSFLFNCLIMLYSLSLVSVTTPHPSIHSLLSSLMSQTFKMIDDLHPQPILLFTPVGFYPSLSWMDSLLNSFFHQKAWYIKPINSVPKKTWSR